MRIRVWASPEGASPSFPSSLRRSVPLVESETVVEAVKKCEATVELVAYPAAGHDSWSATYADPYLWEWLLSHRRGASR